MGRYYGKRLRWILNKIFVCGHLFLVASWSHADALVSIQAFIAWALVQHTIFYQGKCCCATACVSFPSLS